MNEITIAPTSPSVPQQTEKSGRRGGGDGGDFSAILGMAADRRSEAAVSSHRGSERSSERSSDRSSERSSERSERSERPERSNRQEDIKSAEESPVYANGAPAQTESAPVYEESPPQEQPPVVESSAPETTAPVVVDNDPLPEVPADVGNSFSQELQDISSNIKASIPKIEINPDVIPPNITDVVEDLFEDLNGEILFSSVLEEEEEKEIEFEEISFAAAIEDLGDTEGTDDSESIAATAANTPENRNFIYDSYKDNQPVSFTIPSDEGEITITGNITNFEDRGGVLFFQIDNDEWYSLDDIDNLENIKVTKKDTVMSSPPIGEAIENFAVNAAAYTPVPGSVQETLGELVPNLQNMFRDVALSASMTAPGSSSQLVLQLYPEHLGKLRILLEADENGRITARIESGNPNVRALFQAGLRDLIDCLRASGVDLKELEIARLEMNLTDADLGHRSNLNQGNQQSSYQSNPYNSSRQQSVTYIPLPNFTSGDLYENAVINSYIDENVSVEFTA